MSQLITKISKIQYISRTAQRQLQNAMNTLIAFLSEFRSFGARSITEEQAQLPHGNYSSSISHKARSSLDKRVYEGYIIQEFKKKRGGFDRFGMGDGATAEPKIEDKSVQFNGDNEERTKNKGGRERDDKIQQSFVNDQL